MLKCILFGRFHCYPFSFQLLQKCHVICLNKTDRRFFWLQEMSKLTVHVFDFVQHQVSPACSFVNNQLVHSVSVVWCAFCEKSQLLCMPCGDYSVNESNVRFFLFESSLWIYVCVCTCLFVCACVNSFKEFLILIWYSIQLMPMPMAKCQ